MVRTHRLTKPSSDVESTSGGVYGSEINLSALILVGQTYRSWENLIWCRLRRRDMGSRGKT